MSHQYLVPLIDIGLQFKVSETGGLTHELGKVNFMMPGAACLSCIGHLPAQLLSAEALPPEKRALLAKEGYVIGETEPEPSMMAFNALPAARAVQLLSIWLAGRGDVETTCYEQFAPFTLHSRPLISLVRKHKRLGCIFCGKDSLVLSRGDSVSMLVHEQADAA